MEMRRRVLRWLLLFVAVSHLLIGIGAFLSRGFQLQMARLYGAELVLSPELGYVAAMGAAFMVGLGIAGMAAARDPERYRAVVIAFAAVLLLRVLQRLTQLDAIETIFGIPPARSIVNAVFFGALAVALVGLLASTRHPGPDVETS